MHSIQILENRYLHHSLFQYFRRVTYVTAHSPILPSLYLRHSSFSNPSSASPTSQALSLIHLASRPCFVVVNVLLLKDSHVLQLRSETVPVDPGGPVVIIFTSGSEVRGFDPGRGPWIFHSIKILNMTSFGREVKPWVPCRRFTARKWTLSLWAKFVGLYIVYLCLRARQHLRFIGARNEMMMDDYDGQMKFGDLVGLKLLDIRLTGEEKPRKKPHPGNLSRPGIEPGPAAWQVRMLPLAPQRWTNFSDFSRSLLEATMMT